MKAFHWLQLLILDFFRWREPGRVLHLRADVPFLLAHHFDFPHQPLPLHEGSAT